MLLEIIVAGQVLLLGQFVIHLYGELVTVLVPERNTLKRAVSDVRLRHKPVHQVQRCLIHARGRNLTVHKNIGIGGAIGDWTIQPQCGKASSPVVQEVRVGKSSTEPSASGKITCPL